MRVALASALGNATRTVLAIGAALPADASRLLATLSAEGELPETVTDHLAQRSGGNPFFLEEALATSSSAAPS